MPARLVDFAVPLEYFVDVKTRATSSANSRENISLVRFDKRIPCLPAFLISSATSLINGHQVFGPSKQPCFIPADDSKNFV